MASSRLIDERGEWNQSEDDNGALICQLSVLVHNAVWVKKSVGVRLTFAVFFGHES